MLPQKKSNSKSDSTEDRFRGALFFILVLGQQIKSSRNVARKIRIELESQEKTIIIF